MLYRIRPYLHRVALFTAIVLAGLAGVAYLYVSASGAQGETAEHDAQRLAAVAELETQKSLTAAAKRDLTERRQELDRRTAQLEADRQAAMAGLTTSQDAESLSQRINRHAVERGMEIMYFQTADTVTVITGEETLTFIDEGAPNIRRISEACQRIETGQPTGKQQLPAVTYVFKTRGGKDGQIGLIGLVGDTLTTRIEALEIVREDELSDDWTMKVCMHVPYGET